MRVLGLRRSLIVLTVLAVLVGVMAAPVSAGGAEKTPIAGGMALDHFTDADSVRVTPSNVYQQRGGTATTEWTGDLEGTVTFYYRSVMGSADEGRLVSSGPFEGEVTWNGRTGTIRGMFTTNCKPTEFGPSCTGILVAHGSGGLDGVKFHMRWGDGWWPFEYWGYALDAHA